MRKAFISYSHSDKQFVKRLVADLREYGIIVWRDEDEMRVGDSLVERITSAINEVDYVLAIISPHSLNSKWVKEELEQALHLQILGYSIKVLPILLADCELPSFLRSKYFADFRFDASYDESLKKLLKSIDINASRDSHSKDKGYLDSEVLEKTLLPNFFDGQVLFPYALLRLQQAINTLECLTEIKTTRFDPFYEGQFLNADSLNQMVEPIKRLLAAHDLPILFRFYPISDGSDLDPEHLNELVDKINQTIKKRLDSEKMTSR